MSSNTVYYDASFSDEASTSDNDLTTGIAYAWHPHRDTWYSAPLSQINWWISIYDVRSDNAMAFFHLQYWNRKVQNDSRGYNYYEANKFYRGAVLTQYLKSDSRPLPRPTQSRELDPQIRLICPAGGHSVRWSTNASQCPEYLWQNQIQH